MSTFSELWASAQKKRLILVDGGMCRFNFRRDLVLVIYDIIVLPERQGEGIGSRILKYLETLRPIAIEAKCPENLESNKWYAAKGFTKVHTEQGKKWKIYTWRKVLRAPKKEKSNAGH
jgi:GNAT superfamily N-acetyltransferase